ncbi:virulence RhuM family protein [bacterium]|nr:virulence RhuM family protein [bacterium]
MGKEEIVIFDNQQVHLRVNLKGETVWLSQAQMAQLFGRNQGTISRHIKAIYEEQELKEKSTMQKMHIPFSDKQVVFYNLDVIISVGYRVKSPQGTQFRIWANKILKDYLLKGVAINQKRLETLEKTVKLLEIANRSDEIEADGVKGILQLINRFYRALDTLASYDKHQFASGRKRDNTHQLSYRACLQVINSLKYKNENALFGRERNHYLEAILGNIYQSYQGVDVYPTLEEKAAHWFYLLIKDHPFVDGNKRIAAMMLIYFLDYYQMLYHHQEIIIDNIALTSLTLLVAQSRPQEKSLMIALIVDLLSEK